MAPVSDKFACAIAAFDDYHRRDPNTVIDNGVAWPSELLYVERLTHRLDAFAPDAGETVRLAARCQHIGRWEIPRENFPMDKKGYFQWRNEEKIHHCNIAEKVLAKCGYDTGSIEEVKTLLMKKGLHGNEDTQLLEDVVCMVFVEYYLEDFAARHPDEKIVDILRKTFRKMSAGGKSAVDDLNITSRNRSLIERAESLP